MTLNKRSIEELLSNWGHGMEDILCLYEGLKSSVQGSLDQKSVSKLMDGMFAVQSFVKDKQDIHVHQGWTTV